MELRSEEAAFRATGTLGETDVSHVGQCAQRLSPTIS